MDRGDAILAGAVGIFIVAGGLITLYHYTNDGNISETSGPFDVSEPTVGIINRVRMTDVERLEYLALNKGNNWRTYTGQAGTREIPIVPIRATRLGGVYGRTRDSLRAMLTACRGAIEGTPYEGCDPRCVIYLWCIETGYFRFAWNWNLGNEKGCPYATPNSIRQHQVWTSTPLNVDGVFALQDNTLGAIQLNGMSFHGSVDFYPSFPTLADGIAQEIGLFSIDSRFHGNVIGGYRAGGKEGLLAAREAMHVGNYSGQAWNLAQRLKWHSDAAGYWDACERIAGSDWVR